MANLSRFSPHPQFQFSSSSFPARKMEDKSTNVTARDFARMAYTLPKVKETSKPPRKTARRAFPKAAKVTKSRVRKPKADKEETFPTLLSHAGVRSWEELHDKFQECGIPKFKKDSFDYWLKEVMGGEEYELSKLDLKAQKRIYSMDVTFQEKERFNRMCGQDYGTYLKALVGWYRAKIGQHHQGPFVRR